MVQSKFTSQLQTEHDMLQQTMTNQKSALECLQNEIQRSQQYCYGPTAEKNTRWTDPAFGGS